MIMRLLDRIKLGRIKKEAWVTIVAFREVTFAIAERVNRRVQIMRLQWQATELASRIDSVYIEVGKRLANLAAMNTETRRSAADPDHVSVILERMTPLLQQLRDDLSQVAAHLRELEIDTLTETLLRFQQDLISHSRTIERAVVARRAVVLGRSVSQLGLAPMVRIAAVFRGTTALTISGHTGLKAGDVVVLIGPRADVKQALLWFTEGQVALA